MSKLKVLDLFSGIGGFSLGLERTGGFSTVAFCEIEEFPRKVLAKHWPDVPCFNDVRTLEYGGSVDVICGGYPCQPFSVAGNRKGQEDDRHLWPAMFSLIKKHRPTWVLGENVAGHISMGLDDVLADLEGEGYECRAFVIPACAVGANHRRDRIWIIGNAQHDGQSAAAKSGGLKEAIRNNTKGQNKASKFKGADIFSANAKCERHGGRGKNKDSINSARTSSKNKRHNGQKIWCKTSPCPECDENNVTNTISKRTQRQRSKSVQRKSAFSWCENIRRIEDYFNRSDIPQPLICREDDGFSRRVDRLRGLGNAVVPQIPEIIGNAILQAESVGA